MVHGGRPLPSNPALARPPILWAEDFVAIAGSLPLMDPEGGLKPLPESGPYVQPVSFQGATALHLAAFYGHHGVADLLLAAGACDVTARNIQVRLCDCYVSFAFPLHIPVYVTSSQMQILLFTYWFPSPCKQLCLTASQLLKLFSC